MYVIDFGEVIRVSFFCPDSKTKHPWMVFVRDEIETAVGREHNCCDKNVCKRPKRYSKRMDGAQKRQCARVGNKFTSKPKAAFATILQRNACTALPIVTYEVCQPQVNQAWWNAPQSSVCTAHQGWKSLPDFPTEPSQRPKATCAERDRTKTFRTRWGHHE